MTATKTQQRGSPSDNGATPPACDPRVEDWLRSRGVEFSPCQEIPLDRIKVKESRANQARAEALDPETVERYATAMRSGERFPASVVYTSGSGYVIIDGNHRDEASRKAGRSTLLAYVVAPDTPTALLDLLVVEANVRHGLPTSTAWRQQQALHLLALGQPIEVVSAVTNLSASAIGIARRADAATVRARRLGLRGFDDLSITSRAVLGGIAGDPVFQATVEMCTDTGFTPGGDEGKRWISQLKKAPSEAEALRMVGDMQEERSTRARAAGSKRRNVLSNPRMKVLAALGAVTSIDPADLPSLFRTDKERSEVADRCAAAALVLMQAEEVLQGGASDAPAE